MKDLKINNHYQGLRIIVVPLDWGLGHITRCIPIIYALQKAGAEVYCAGDSKAEIIFKKEFPNIHFLPLKGYNIQYSASKIWFLPKILTQLPSIASSIKRENLWLKNLVSEYKINGIISDNRPGMYHKFIPCAYLTHQLFIETGMSWLNKYVQRLHYSYINRFDVCWVPDSAGPENLTGKLSHPATLPEIPVTYLGSLSRFKKGKLPFINDLLIILSGPEPQRSIFEKIILSQIISFKGEVVLVRGLPVSNEILQTAAHVRVFNHLPAEKLETLIKESRMVLSRSGYTTIMDMISLQHYAILVPTPGQGEQEYLAEYLHKKEIFYSCSQQNFKLHTALRKADVFYDNARFPNLEFNDSVIAEWLDTVAASKNNL